MSLWRRYPPATALWLFGVALPLAAAEPPGPDNSEALIEEYTLELDGKSIDVRAGQESIVDVGGKKVRAKLTAKPDKLFRAGGVSFRIPREYSLEIGKEPDGTQTWTFDGNNGIVHLARFPNAVPPKQVVRDAVNRLKAQYGETNVKTKDASLKLGGRVHPGTRLTVRIAGQTSTQDISAFETGGVTFVVMVQETPQEDGSSGAEVRRVRELLATTFQVDAGQN
jgi:hypothetical protein